MTKTQLKYGYKMPNMCPPYGDGFPTAFLQASWNAEMINTKHGIKRNTQLLKRLRRWYGIV